MSKEDFDKYIEKGSYPDKPVMEQQSWKPHYHRKKGPNKMGVANRNERVKNPGPGGPKKNGPKNKPQHHDGAAHGNGNGNGNGHGHGHGHGGQH
jgi:deoxyribodipyrimidine photo-lyase